MSNIHVFLEKYSNDKIPDEIEELSLFTKNRKLSKNITSNNSKYVLNNKGKEYRFSLFSDWNLQDIDKKILVSDERGEYSLCRSLKLVNSLDLIIPKLVIGHSLNNELCLLITYYDQKQEKVIDYANNLVMNKDEYYELFDFKEFNVLDKVDLYNLYFILEDLGAYKNIYELLIFTKEIFNELSKNKHFSYLKKKFDYMGINKHNYYFLGDKFDHLFFQREDYNGTEYDDVIEEIENFTMDPNLDSLSIKYNYEEECFYFENSKISFKFNLLSDLFLNTPVEKILLSQSRYRKCHINSIRLVNALTDYDCKVVSGKYKINEIDYLYHSWVEIDSLNIVMDFNFNLVIDKDDYYKLFQPVAINKTSIDDINKHLDKKDEFSVLLHSADICYFGDNIYNDLVKNERILRK